MAAFTPEAISRFEEVLRKDPKSQVFAPLAEAYREDLRLVDAERITSMGVRLHPQFASGWVVRGKVLRDMKRLDDAIAALKKAIAVAPENLLALQILGEISLELKQPKEALRSFKRVLFLNPLAEKAKRIVSKLESLTADEFDEETFAMTRLAPLSAAKTALSPASTSTPTNLPPPAAVPNTPPSQGMARMLSLIDAFIVRSDLARAAELLRETATEFGEHAEISRRQQVLQRRSSHHLSSAREEAESLAPLQSREEAIRLKKVAVLKSLLRDIEQFKDASLT